MLTDLKPCPFCGAQPESPDVGDYFVECPSCGVQGPISNKDGQPHAKEEWNRRAIEAEVRTEAQGPVTVGTIAHYSGCSSLIKALTRITQQPPAPCQSSTDTEYYRAECEKLQAQVDELESFRALAVENASVTANEAAHYQKRIAEQSAEIERLTKINSEVVRRSNTNVVQNARFEETITEQAALIEMCKTQMCKARLYVRVDIEKILDVGLDAIATHKKGITQ